MSVARFGSTKRFALHIGEGEKLVGIEILDAKQVLGAGQLPKVVLENLSLAGV